MKELPMEMMDLSSMTGDGKDSDRALEDTRTNDVDNPKAATTGEIAVVFSRRRAHPAD